MLQSPRRKYANTGLETLFFADSAEVEVTEPSESGLSQLACEERDRRQHKAYLSGPIAAPEEFLNSSSGVELLPS